MFLLAAVRGMSAVMHAKLCPPQDADLSHLTTLSSGHARAVKWGPLEQGDILDRARLEEVLLAYKPVAVMHFAAFAYVGESVEKPDKYYRNNVVGTLSLLDAMRECEVNKIVFSSSCATYGIPETTPISERSRQLPVNPYGRTKLIVEQVLKDYGSSYGSGRLAFDTSMPPELIQTAR